MLRVRACRYQFCITYAASSCMPISVFYNLRCECVYADISVSYNVCCECVYVDTQYPSDLGRQTSCAAGDPQCVQNVRNSALGANRRTAMSVFCMEFVLRAHTRHPYIRSDPGCVFHIHANSVCSVRAAGMCAIAQFFSFLLYNAGGLVGKCVRSFTVKFRVRFSLEPLFVFSLWI